MALAEKSEGQEGNAKGPGLLAPYFFLHGVYANDGTLSNEGQECGPNVVDGATACPWMLSIGGFSFGTKGKQGIRFWLRSLATMLVRWLS